MTDLLSAAHEARRLAEEATPGPWRRGNGDFGGCVFSGNPAVYVARCGWPADDDQCYPNAGLIAHAGTHYGALAAAYIEAVGERDRRSAMSVEAFRQTYRDAVEETQQCGCDDGLGCYFNLPAKDRVRCSAEAWATAAEREYASAMDEITALRAALSEARTEADTLRAERGDGFGPLVDEVLAWQAETFKQGTAASAAAHLLKEAKELVENPTDPEELADCFFLVVAGARRAGVDLPAAVRAKLEVNRLRKWGEPDENGVVEHVRAALSAAPEKEERDADPTV